MLRSKEFYIGLLVGYLLVVFIPSLNFKTRMGK